MDTKPLLTIAETCDFLSIRPGTQDNRVSVLINLVTAAFEGATGRNFTSQTFTEYLTTRDNQKSDYDFWGSSDYAVPTTTFGGMATIVNPQSIPLIGVNVDPDTFAAWYNPYARSPADYGDCNALASGVDYQIDTDANRLILYRGTRFRLRALKVVYVAGYAAAPSDDNPGEITLSASIPAWLKSAALIQAQFFNIKLRNDNIGMASERTISSAGGKTSKMFMANFLTVNGVTPEALPFIAHLKRPGIGKG